MFTHLVLFKLQDPTAENAAELCAKLHSLVGRVPQIRQLEVGADVLRSPRSFDVGLIVRLDSQADLDLYQNHPYHQEILAYVRTVISEAKAVDF
ncbi:MAG: Dabb family protein [Chloroflexi bacterium]|nr:Dabb family protein [Chloroflexota bacterium]MDA0242878.1 Dabb family protein [Chloroflexota bacterium]